MTKKQLTSTFGWAIAIISLLAILTIALAVVTGGFKNWDVKTWFNNETEIVCEHEFVDGTCTKCEEICEHEFENGTCVKCEMPEETCEHEFENGACTSCGELELTE
ncbi:MAG: hypothetical protein IJW26_00750 [Clostridia bacterium]|nr:hypothetical protein [Clostridia bacterium]